MLIGPVVGRGRSRCLAKNQMARGCAALCDSVGPMLDSNCAAGSSVEGGSDVAGRKDSWHCGATALVRQNPAITWDTGTLEPLRIGPNTDPRENNAGLEHSPVRKCDAVCAGLAMDRFDLGPCMDLDAL